MARHGTSTAKDRIKFVREINKKTQAEFAAALGTTRGAVGNWELGKGIKTENLVLISQRFSVPLDWLVSGIGQPPGAGQEIRAGLHNIGEVAAGQWLETPPFEAHGDGELPIIDVRYPPEAQYALSVRGTSINRIAPNGSVLVCIDVSKADIQISNGDLVVVQRRRQQGGLVEVTAKRVRRRTKTIVELVPESDDPRWQDPVILDESKAGEDEEISIIALVVGVYRPVNTAQNHARRPETP